VLSDPIQRQRYDQRIELNDRFMERRGSGAMAPARPDVQAGGPSVSRPFVFRPLA
jgi:hypothetical protein